MFIKRILLKNFKSYKNLEMSFDLSAQTNLVVGKNGNGKTSLLESILFVVTDLFSGISPQDKAAYLHEQPDREETKISVTLVFDNSAGRIPINSEEVSLTKSYDCQAKIEEFSVNGKKMSKSVFANLLQSSGFVKDNSYYIVKQGKISTILNLTENQLFELLSEVSTVKLFETKMKESLEMLTQAERETDEIEMNLEQLKQQKDKLDRQTGRLKEFEEVEKESFAIEHILETKALAAAEKTYKSCYAILNNLMTYSTEENEDVTEELSKLAEEESAVKMLNLQVKAEKEKLLTVSKEINKTDKLLIHLQNKLSVANTVESSRQEEDSTPLKEKVSLLKTKVKDIDSALGAEQAAVTKIHSEIEGYRLLMSRNKTEVIKAEKDEIKDLIEQAEERRMSQQNDNLEEKEEKYAKLLEKSSKLPSVAEKIKNLRKVQEELRKNSSELSAEISRLAKEEGEVENQLFDLRNKNLTASLVEHVLRLKEEHFPGLVGVVFELIECDESARDKLDLAAKEKLFTILTEDYDSAEKIVEYNKKKKGPQIQVIPLEWVVAEETVAVPNGRNLEELFNFKEDEIEYGLRAQNSSFTSDTVKTAIRNIFNRIVLVENYRAALETSKKHKVTCITEFNEVVYSGAFSCRVGKTNKFDNRLQISLEVAQMTNRRCKVSQDRLDLEDSLEAITDKEKRINLEINDLIVEKNHLETANYKAEKDRKQLETEIKQLKRARDLKERESEEKERQLEIMKNKLALLQSLEENDGKVDSSLIDTQYERISEKKKVLTELENKKETLHSEISELEGKLESITLSAEQNRTVAVLDSTEVEELEHKLETVKANKKTYTAVKLKLEEEIAQKQSNLVKLHSSVVQKNSELQKEKAKMQERKIEIKKNRLKLETARRKKEEHAKKLEFLSQTDERLVKRFSAELVSIEALKAKLADLKREMGKFNNINKNATQDLLRFKKQEEEVETALKRIESERNEIKELAEYCENKHKERFEDNLKVICTSFNLIFKALTGSGQGVLQVDRESESLKVRVSFEESEGFRLLHQLSGGQRAVVALSLIFALARAEQPPLYILDEVDAPLDVQFRANLGNYLKKLGRENQVFVSSFKMELLNCAENYVGVKCEDKESTVDQIAMEAATEFLS